MRTARTKRHAQPISKEQQLSLHRRSANTAQTAAAEHALNFSSQAKQHLRKSWEITVWPAQKEMIFQQPVVSEPLWRD